MHPQIIVYFAYGYLVFSAGVAYFDTSFVPARRFQQQLVAIVGLGIVDFLFVFLRLTDTPLVIAMLGFAFVQLVAFGFALRPFLPMPLDPTLGNEQYRNKNLARR